MLPPSLLGNDKFFLSTPVLLGLLAATTAVTFSSLCSWNSDDKERDDVTQIEFLPAVPVLGNTLEVAANTKRFQDWTADHSRERDGQPFGVRLLGKKDIIYFARPEHFEQVLKVQSSNFKKGAGLRDVYSDFTGKSILLANGEHWKYHRKVLVNLFSARALRDFMTPVIQKNVQVLTETLSRASEKGEVVDFYKLVHKFTFETFTEIGFGKKLDTLTSPKDKPFELAFDEAHEIVGNRFTTPTWLWKLKRWLDVGTERRLRDSMTVINEFIMNTISSTMERRQLHKEQGGDHPVNKDIVSIILDTMETSGQTITPDDVRDIVFAGMIAGRDTTADALSWLFHMLHHNTRVVTKLREELAAKLPKFATENYVPSMEDLQYLPYLEATIREVLRLFPSAPTVAYHCIRDTMFSDGTLVPEGAGIFLSLYSAARLESVWGPDAASFVPERFLDEDSGDFLQMASSKFVAFSAGPRVCVGRNLAMLELKLVTACLVSRFNLVEESGQDVTYSRGITLGMKNPLLMKVEQVPIARAN